MISMYLAIRQRLFPWITVGVLVQLVLFCFIWAQADFLCMKVVQPSAVSLEISEYLIGPSGLEEFGFVGGTILEMPMAQCAVWGGILVWFLSQFALYKFEDVALLERDGWVLVVVFVGKCSCCELHCEGWFVVVIEG